ncbi:MAG: hypothetical protein V4714_11740 [Bacteroidota bacterium]
MSKTLNLFSICIFLLLIVFSCQFSDVCCSKDSFGFYNSVSCLSGEKLLDDDFVLLKWPNYYIKQEGHTFVHYEHIANDNSVFIRAIYSIDHKQLDSIKIAAILQNKNCKFVSELTAIDSLSQKAFVQNQTSGEIYLLGWNPRNGMSVYKDYLPNKKVK